MALLKDGEHFTNPSSVTISKYCTKFSVFSSLPSPLDDSVDALLSSPQYSPTSRGLVLPSSYALTTPLNIWGAFVFCIYCLTGNIQAHKYPT